MSSVSALVTVVIPTHNRATLLARCIDSILAERDPEATREILVVDNCSTDDTRTVAEHKGVRYVFESKLGLNQARNVGWQNARGQYVAYIDDDAIAKPGWVPAIVRTFKDVKPTPGCVGGPIEPMWEVPRPSWVSDGIVSALGALDWSDRPHVIETIGRQWLGGGNIAFRRDVLQRVGGFHPRLDRVGKKLLSSGEVFAQEQVTLSGETCYYEPTMVVGHLVYASRLRRTWFLRRYYWQGISNSVMQLIREQPTPARRLSLAVRMAASIVTQPRRLARIVTPTRDPTGFTSQCYDYITLGHIAGLLGAARWK